MIDSESTFLFLLMIFLTTFGLFANSASLLKLSVNLRQRTRMTKAVSLFCLLSLTDFLFCAFISAPMTMAVRLGKDALGSYCNLHSVLSRWLLYYQTILLVTIGYDRAYLSIKPLRYRKQYSLCQALLYTLSGVTVTGAISLPKLSIQFFHFNGKLGQCILLGFKEPNSLGAIALNTADKVFGFGGMLLLLCCNTMVVFANQARQRRIMKCSRKTPQRLTILAITVMFVFVVSSLPYFIVKILFHVNRQLMTPPMNPWIKRLVFSSYYLMHVSSTVNPVLYVLQGRNTKHHSGDGSTGCFDSGFQTIFNTIIQSYGDHSKFSQVTSNPNDMALVKLGSSSIVIGSNNNLINDAV